MRVVLDTNVLVSGFATPHGVSGQILARWTGGEFELVTSSEILNEFEDVMSRPYFASRFAEEIRRANLALVRQKSVMVSVAGPVPVVVSDSADNVVLETAVQGMAEYLVTGDGLVLSLGTHRDIDVVSPRFFLSLLEER